jgi:predicted cupin superfamily sugar epimerase
VTGGRAVAGGDGAELAHGLQIAAALGLEPLESEGGLFRRTYTSESVTAIYYLVAGQDFSAMHRMKTSDELFLFHAGSPLRMLILDPLPGREELLGPDPLLGHHPQLLVAGGVWQGASSTGSWSLVSTVVAPGFQWSDFELGDRSELTADHPRWAERLDQLCR